MGVDWSSQEYWTYVQFCDNDRILELFVNVSLTLPFSQVLSSYWHTVYMYSVFLLLLGALS